MSIPHIEVINLGDELLLGLRDNTHLAYLGKTLMRYGLRIQRDLVITDQQEEIEKNFKVCWQQADIIITTGGLGPTRDDNTRQTIANVLDLPLIHKPELEATIRERFTRRGQSMPDNNRCQAALIQGAEALDNPQGTAPGQWLEHEGKYLIMLPGPATELCPMFEKTVIPRLKQKRLLQPENAYLQLRCIGMGESQLATLVEPLFQEYSSALGVAYCAHEGIVDVRLSSLLPNQLSWENIKTIGEKCEEVLGENFMGYGECTLAQIILNQLNTLGKKVAVAESCTGGLLANAFTDLSGASKVFTGGAICYNDAIKTQILEIPEDIILQHGAVSDECAIAMATAAAELFEADYALSTTGFTGPDGGSKEHPVGTVFIGYHTPAGVQSHRITFNGDRLSVKRRAVTTALDWMRRNLSRSSAQDILETLL